MICVDGPLINTGERTAPPPDTHTRQTSKQLLLISPSPATLKLRPYGAIEIRLLLLLLLFIIIIIIVLRHRGLR